MPRYRTISCSNCGFMLLKRDDECERCGAMTWRFKAKAVAFVVTIATVIVAFLYIRNAISGLGAALGG